MSFLKNETVSWSLKNIFLSLLPFIIGATFRIFYWGKISFDVFDPSELAFSMAILFIIVLQSVSILDDDNLKTSLSSIVQMGIIFSLALFASALLLKIHLESELLNQFNGFKDLSKTNPELISGLIDERANDSFHGILHRVNIGSIFLAVISVPLVITLKNRYKLS